ncbi:hypothetical protein GLU60_03920 [Nanohaloarchaea archaeon H01]|jgi:hypothetical protein|nr:hypothetical protein [Nanohaloarchaea archaeon H01]
MGNQVLGSMIMTSLAPILPGFMYILFVEPVDNIKKYRFRFVSRQGKLEQFNNTVSVGITGYILFAATVPIFNWFLNSLIGTGIRSSVESAGVWVQGIALVILTVTNISLAFLGLEK